MASAGRKSKVAASPLRSQQPTSGRKCYVTRRMSRIPNAKRREKIRSGYLTHAFTGPQEWAEVPCKRSILGGPQCQARGDNRNWLLHPCILNGPKVVKPPILIFSPRLALETSRMQGLRSTSIHAWGPENAGVR